MKLVIGGSREFLRLNKVYDYIANLPKDTVIISGGARGVDDAAARAAIENNLKFIEMPADWHLLGKAAGHIRNMKMVDEGDEVVAFHDGVSKGTASLIQYAKLEGKLKEVINDK